MHTRSTARRQARAEFISRNNAYSYGPNQPSQHDVIHRCQRVGDGRRQCVSRGYATRITANQPLSCGGWPFVRIRFTDECIWANAAWDVCMYIYVFSYSISRKKKKHPVNSSQDYWLTTKLEHLLARCFSQNIMCNVFEPIYGESS